MSSLPAIPPTGTEPASATAISPNEIEYHLLRTSYDLMLRTTVMTAGIVPIFILLFLNIFPRNLLIAYSVMMVARLLLSAWTLRAWRSRADVAAANVDRWRRLYNVNVVVAAVAWSAVPSYMMTQASAGEMAVLVVMFLTVCAVSINTQAAQLRCMVVFLGIVLIPPALATFTHASLLETLLGAELLGALVVLSLVGRRTHFGLRRQTEDKLNLRNAVALAGAAQLQAQASSEAKSRFLANMSHELRTPLNAVIGAAQLLKGHQTDPDVQIQLVDAIHQSGNNLLELIENILDISRIEAGELKLIADDFDLQACVQSAVATGSLAARTKGLSLKLNFQPDLPAQRRADAARIKQILINLLGNSLKFTVAGEVVLTVARGTEPDQVSFTIQDTGVGISKAALPNIFDAFQQGDDQASRRFGGSGLGLSIVRQLVIAMGGTIHVTSEVDVGTQVEFVLPLPPASTVLNAAPAPVSALTTITDPANNAVERRLHVMVVDDDALNRAIVCRILEQGEFEAMPASDGTHALRLLAQNEFDVVLMDWQMPDMDGLECTRRIRQGASGARGLTVPIIALTANAFSEDRVACLAAGMNDFLTKPVQADLLRATVRRWARSVGTPADGDDPTVKSPSKTSARFPLALAYDPSVLPKLLGTDASNIEVETEVIEMFVTSWSASMLAIDHAIATKDNGGLRLQVHTLKSTSASVGAMEMAAIATTLDHQLHAATSSSASAAFGGIDVSGVAGKLSESFIRFQAALAVHRNGVDIS